MSVLVLVNQIADVRALVPLGVSLALGAEQPLHVLRRVTTGSEPDESEPGDDSLREKFADVVRGCVSAAAADIDKSAPELNVGFLPESDWQTAFCREARERKASLSVFPSALVSEERDARWLGSLPGNLACPVLVLKAAAEFRKVKQVLIPVAGGPHGPAALRLGRDIAAVTGGKAVCLTVETVDDEDAKAIALERAKRVVNRAGLGKDESVLAEGVAAPDPRQAIISRARDKADLLLLGATEHGAFYRKLFGIIPESLMRGESAISVGIVHAAPGPASRLVGSFRERLRGLLPQLDREVRVQVFERIQDGSRLGIDFGLLLALSAAIAAFGLVQGSTAVVIGAMLVAPLMTPMIGFALAISQANMRMARDCTVSVITGAAVAVGVAALLGGAVRAFGLDAGLTREILSRCGPNVLDLGVAFCSGLAGAYAMVRPNLAGAVAGVAIAAALVPPLSTTGLMLSWGELGAAQASAMLFGANLVAIVLGAFGAFRLVGLGRGGSSSVARVWALRVLLFFALAAAAFAFAFSLGLARIHGAASEEESLYRVQRVVREELRDSEAVPITIKSMDNEERSFVVVVASRDRASGSGEIAGRISERLAHDLHQTYTVKVLLVRPEEDGALNPKAVQENKQYE